MRLCCALPLFITSCIALQPSVSWLHVEAGWYWKQDLCGNVFLLILPRSRPPQRFRFRVTLAVSPSVGRFVQGSLPPLNTCSNVFSLHLTVCSLPCCRGGFKVPCHFMNVFCLPNQRVLFPVLTVFFICSSSHILIPYAEMINR